MENPYELWHDVSAFLYPDERRGPWMVRIGWRPVAGRMEPVGFELAQRDADGTPTVPTEVLTAKMVRELHIGEYIERGRRIKAGSAAIVARDYREKDRPDDAQRAQEYGRRFKAKVGGRPHMYGDDHYREVARVYAEAWRKGEPPTQAVERHPDFAPLSHSTAARWVRECRKRGFLGETKKRRAGGVLPNEQEGDTWHK